MAVASGAAVDLTGWNNDKAVNAFANTAVSSIVPEVPDGALASSGACAYTPWTAE
jgi:hypothetical protein